MKTVNKGYPAIFNCVKTDKFFEILKNMGRKFFGRNQRQNKYLVLLINKIYKDHSKIKYTYLNHKIYCSLKCTFCMKNHLKHIKRKQT